jgi:signal transduction histidine kinase
LDGALGGTEQAITESRNAIQGLRSELTAQSDLAQLLNAAGQELAAVRDMSCEPPAFRVIVEGDRRMLVPILQDEVYRIARELIRNAFRHAVARRIEVEVRYGQRQLRLRIRDDGKGIDPKFLQNKGRAGHWGLPGIRERAQRIGAQLEFWSETGAGTEVELTLSAAIAYDKKREGQRLRAVRKAESHEQIS